MMISFSLLIKKQWNIKSKKYLFIFADKTFVIFIIFFNYNYLSKYLLIKSKHGNTLEKLFSKFISSNPFFLIFNKLKIFFFEKSN